MRTVGTFLQLVSMISIQGLQKTACNLLNCALHTYSTCCTCDCGSTKSDCKHKKAQFFHSLRHTQQNIHGSVTECGRQHPVTDPYTLRYRPGKVHVAYRLYIRICAALIQYRYGTDLLYGSVTDVLSYLLYTNCIYMFIQ